ncbi:MAG: guanylate cyclase [Rhodocyclales bacterium]|nr:guanylate cyclase [Rhodocyclales bacterium]
METLQAELDRLRGELAGIRQQLVDTEQAFGRFVPREFLHFLSIDNVREVRLGMQTERKLTILFADIRNFTGLSETMTPQENFDFLNSYLSQMEPMIVPFRGLIDKYIGDAIMALFPKETDDAVRSALAMLERLDNYNKGRARAGYLPIRIGIGINTGIVMLGTVGGSGRMEGTVISDAVNLASRLEDMSKTFEVPLLISEHTLHSLIDPDKYSIRFLARNRVKGKQEAQSVYEVFDGDPPAMRAAKLRTRKRFEEAMAFYFVADIFRARTRLVRCLDEAPDDKPARLYLARCDAYLRNGHAEGIEENELTQSWSEDYSSGVADIDSHHRALLSQLNALATAVREGRSSDAMPILTRIARETEAQFNAEMVQMQDSRYRFQADHDHQHRRFLRNLARLSDEILSETENAIYLSFRIKLLLMDWTINHSVKTDRHLGHHLKSRSGG